MIERQEPQFGTTKWNTKWQMAWEDYTINNNEYRTIKMFQNYGLPGICPVSIIVKDHVLETVSVSNLRYKGWKAPTHLCPLGVNLNSLDLSNPDCNTPTMTEVLSCNNLMSNFRKSSTSQILWLSWCTYWSKRRTYSLTSHLNAICCANPSTACDKKHFGSGDRG